MVEDQVPFVAQCVPAGSEPVGTELKKFLSDVPFPGS